MSPLTLEKRYKIKPYLVLSISYHNIQVMIITSFTMSLSEAIILKRYLQGQVNLKKDR